MNKYRIIWIDDQREPARPINWKDVIPSEFADLLKNEQPQIIWLQGFQSWINWAKKNWFGNKNEKYIDCICLDHDLGDFDKNGKEYTGVDVAKTIVNDVLNYDKKLPFYECHSSNPSGKENILSIFESYQKYLIL